MKKTNYNFFIFLKGELFSKVKERLFKKLGVQEKEFEKVKLQIINFIIKFVNFDSFFIN